MIVTRDVCRWTKPSRGLEIPGFPRDPQKGSESSEAATRSKRRGPEDGKRQGEGKPGERVVMRANCLQQPMCNSAGCPAVFLFFRSLLARARDNCKRKRRAYQTLIGVIENAEGFSSVFSFWSLIGLPVVLPAQVLCDWRMP